ncbi:TetR-like C-terminal domain-containing protein [Ralstonia soli]|uniref:TetR/AcrR family transcriptional regulator C-terminal ligand-binding domain-containing protein n=1 Tax=Ralstonia soli TaxID=2953896 RepID=A0ABT1AGA0_9RALS|nr:TetR-like C-terminal domain-containing protein [Ralstonia soli]MCO5397338.1 TetR/AcrR family transcriptional regulator C-terminal ligand-binding domain-containing protein [Ralstonia soli]
MTAAVLQLIEAGQIDFELQEVARLSGVHRTTIHRRWPDRASLIAEALSEHTSHIDVQFTGDWRADIRHVAFALRDFLSNPAEVAMNTLLASTDNAEFREMMTGHWGTVMAVFQTPILQAQARGEIDARHDAEMLVSMMIAPIVSNIIFIKQTPDDRFMERLVAQLINACS